MIPQIGDFVTIAELTAKVIQALNTSRGSKFEFLSLLNTLEALHQAAWQAEALCVASSLDYTYKDTRCHEFLNSVVCAITREREECQSLINKFSEDFPSYIKVFTKEGTGKMHQRARSLTWMGCKEEVATLEKRLNGHLQALQLQLCRFY